MRTQLQAIHSCEITDLNGVRAKSNEPDGKCFSSVTSDLLPLWVYLTEYTHVKNPRMLFTSHGYDLDNPKSYEQ